MPSNPLSSDGKAQKTEKLGENGIGGGGGGGGEEEEYVNDWITTHQGISEHS